MPSSPFSGTPRDRGHAFIPCSQAVESHPEPGAIACYVAAAQQRLSAFVAGTTAADTAEELRGHLEDAANEMQLSGLEPRLSEHEAVRRFGSPDEIAGDLAAVYRSRRAGFGILLGGRGRRIMTVMVAAAAVAALGEGAVALAGTPPGTPAPPPMRAPGAVHPVRPRVMCGGKHLAIAILHSDDEAAVAIPTSRAPSRTVIATTRVQREIPGARQQQAVDGCDDER